MKHDQLRRSGVEPAWRSCVDVCRRMPVGGPVVTQHPGWALLIRSRLQRTDPRPTTPATLAPVTVVAAQEWNSVSIVLRECVVRNVLPLTTADRRRDRPGNLTDDLCFTPELVEVFLGEYTQVSDVVFDPFAGFGTALVVAERMQRRPLGLEILEARGIHPLPAHRFVGSPDR